MDIAGSSNGRTHPSGGWYLGSNPGPAATIESIEVDRGGEVSISTIKSPALAGLCLRKSDVYNLSCPDLGQVAI
ncbi:MAG: hypothetical protein UW46_C0004G0013 [Candidatus Yanofskybacteria bacterium GW2011_GWF1_44_227]|nr:MAG: hypothetical protein UW46_C0004G0013 [Candidatus Yanofskybacteria bacterium GW2011_GWF1_44_227]